MKLTLATLSLGLAAVAAVPAPTQADKDGKEFVSVSVIDGVTYPYPHGIYKHSVEPSEATWLTGSTVTVTVTTTVTTSVATASTTKVVTTTRPSKVVTTKCNDLVI